MERKYKYQGSAWRPERNSAPAGIISEKVNPWREIKGYIKGLKVMLSQSRLPACNQEESRVRGVDLKQVHALIDTSDENGWQWKCNWQQKKYCFLWSNTSGWEKVRAWGSRVLMVKSTFDTTKLGEANNSSAPSKSGVSSNPVEAMLLKWCRLRRFIPSSSLRPRRDLLLGLSIDELLFPQLPLYTKIRVNQIISSNNQPNFIA